MRKRGQEKLNFQKKVRRLYDEYTELDKAQYTDGGYYQKVEPFADGYYRTFVLRNDITRRKDVKNIRRVLKLVNNRQFSSTKEFKQYDYLRKKFVPRPQSLKILTKKEYENISPILQKYFEKCVIYRGLTRIEGYKVVYPYWFVFKLYRRIIHYKWIPYSDYERRLNYLYDKLYDGGRYERELCRINGWRNWRSSEYEEKGKYKVILNEDIESMIDDDMTEEEEDVYSSFFI